MPAARSSSPSRCAALGHGGNGDEPYLSLTRHQHGVAGRQRHDRADAAGQSRAHAEPGQGDPAVHGREPATATTASRKAAGFLNARGAVELAQSLAAGGPLGHVTTRTIPTRWSGHDHLGQSPARAAASSSRAPTRWHTDVDLGQPTTPDGDDVIWGRTCAAADCSDAVTAPRPSENIVWGTVRTERTSSGARARRPRTSSGARPVAAPSATSIVWGTSRATTSLPRHHRPAEGDIVVWGTLAEDASEMSDPPQGRWGVS